MLSLFNNRIAQLDLNNTPNVLFSKADFNIWTITNVMPSTDLLHCTANIVHIFIC